MSERHAAPTSFAALAALCFAACSFQGSPGQLDSSDASSVDAPPVSADAAPDAPQNDTDGDGVDNDIDNCPEDANPAQENEDADAFGNACDRCPTIDDAATEQLDDDNDGIGNDCDPQPGVQNSMIFFEGFDVAIDGSEWSGETNWTQDTAAGVMRREDNLARVFLTRNDIGGDDQVFVVAAMDFDNENQAGLNFRFGGVFSESSLNGSNHQGCWVIRTSIDEELLGFVRHNSSGPTAFTNTTTNVVENRLYTFTHAVQGTTHTCAEASNGGLRSFTLESGANFQGDDVGVVASFVTANLYYVYAIRLQ